MEIIQATTPVIKNTTTKYVQLIAAACEYYEAYEPRGEYALVIEGCEEAGIKKPDEADGLISLTPEEHVKHYENRGLSRMDAIKKAAKDRGTTKSELYKLLHS